MRILDLVFGTLIVLKGLIKVLSVNKCFLNFYLYIPTMGINKRYRLKIHKQTHTRYLNSLVPSILKTLIVDFKFFI